MDPCCDPEVRHGGRCRQAMFTKQVSGPGRSQIAGPRNRWSGAKSEFSHPTGFSTCRPRLATLALGPCERDGPNDWFGRPMQGDDSSREVEDRLSDGVKASTALTQSHPYALRYLRLPDRTIESVVTLANVSFEKHREGAADVSFEKH